jgi:hypothetical protein
MGYFAEVENNFIVSMCKAKSLVMTFVVQVTPPVPVLFTLLSYFEISHATERALFILDFTNCTLLWWQNYILLHAVSSNISVSYTYIIFGLVHR